MKKFRKRTKRELAANAYHEAGHAVIRRAFGGRIKKATIVYNPREDTQGCVYHEPICFENPDISRTEIIIALAGDEAQRRFDPASRDGFAGDYQKIKCIMTGQSNRMIRRVLRSMEPNPFADLPACADFSDDELEELADDFFGDQDCEPLDFETCRRECKRLVRDNWPAIEKLAEALLKRWTLTGREIEALLS